MPPSEPRALVLTALPLEYEAVRSLLDDLEPRFHDGSRYEVGRLVTEETAQVGVEGGHGRTSLRSASALWPWASTRVTLRSQAPFKAPVSAA